MQNLIKRDPDSYKDEFQQQHRHFQATLEVFKLSPAVYNQSLEELSIFLARVAKCYSQELATYPQVLIDVLREHSTVLNPDMRLSFCRALILLRHKGLLHRQAKSSYSCRSITQLPRLTEFLNNAQDNIVEISCRRLLFVPDITAGSFCG